MTAVFLYYFGWPQGQVWPNLTASALCAGLVWWRLHRQGALQHAEVLAQAARHHAALLAQAARHHKELAGLHERRHEELVSHVSAVGAHVVTASVAVPQRLLDDIRNAPPRKPPSGGSKTSPGDSAAVT